MVNKNNIIDAGEGEEDSKPTVASDKVDAAAAAPLLEEKSGSGGGEYVENLKILALISSLTALMLQVKQLAEGEK